MEKQLAVLGYWLGILSLVLAVIFRLMSAASMIPPHMGAAGGNAMSYLTFLHGAGLFFLLSIASWCRTARQ
jgi:hypothetical protein